LRQQRAVQHHGNSLPFDDKVAGIRLEAVHEAATSDVAGSLSQRQLACHRKAQSDRPDLSHARMPAASAAANAHRCANKKEPAMRMPAILQGEARTRFFQGIAFGAVAAMTIGFIWGGWVTGGTARSMTFMAENTGRMSVLVPMCVAQFTAADGALTKFKAASSYSRDGVIGEYVKTVAATNMDYSLARACSAGVEAELSKTATKS
jgi:hypothetical protein